MTLERAIEILNERNHDGHSDWVGYALHSFMDGFKCLARTSVGDYKVINKAEAIAIAEKYERDGH